jgi:hypothetical protein
MQPGSWVNVARAERVAGVFALLSLATAVLILGRPGFTNAARPARSLSDPFVAIQVIENIGEVDDILSEAPSPDREVMRIKQYLDFGFIASYAGLFCTLALLLARSGTWGKMAGLVAGICGLATAAFDVRENFAILRILDLRLEQTTAPMMNAIRSASAAKWALSALTLALVATYFLRDHRWVRRGIGTLMLAGAALQVYGLVDNVWLIRQGLFLGAALIALVALFFRIHPRPI